MSGDEIDLEDLLGPEPIDPNEVIEVLVDEAPTSRPMGEASRSLVERSRRYPVNRAAKKNSPDRLSRLLSYAAEMPVGTSAALRAGISYATLKYWLQKSSEGAPGDGFDIVLGENDETGPDSNVIRFHEAWDLAMTAGVEKVEYATMQRATGYLEPQTYRGKVVYKLDPLKVEIALMLGDREDGPENYLLDAFGAPVPETVWKMDPDLAMFILKSRKSQVYGPKATVEMNVRGGVLVIPMRAASSEALNEIETEYRRQGMPEVAFDEGEDDE